MKKRVFAALLAVCVLVSMAGCSVLEDVESSLNPTEAVFSINTYDLQITADSTFQEKTAGSFDLQITNGSAYISVMAYKYIDLPEDLTAQDIYDVQNEDLFGRRTNVKVVEADKTQAFEKCTLTQGLYSAEKDGVKNYYATYLLDFPNQETAAWVLVTAVPSYMEANREYLHNIVCSLKAVE